jgi:FkbH-like protein
LLSAALTPNGMPDLYELDDAAIFCLAILLGRAGRTNEVAPFLDFARSHRVESYYAPLAADLANHFAPREVEDLKIKLVIWDLDDTLWQGTLADGDEPVLDEKRADYVRMFNQRGIISAICSKNDLQAAKAKLEALGLWDEFVFPRIAFVPKGAVVRQMIADMQLRPQNVLFVDDNPHNLREVAAASPEIRVVDARLPECDALLQRIADDNAHVSKSRIADYRLLETKVEERETNALSDEAFLLQSGIQATFSDRMDNLEFAERIEELINRSNQLNYTNSRAEPGEIRSRILDLDNYEVLTAFVWDKFGYYGLVGVAVLNFCTNKLEHLAFSCRIMHMGVEDAMIRRLAERGFRVAPSELRKRLPEQSARAITVLPFHDSEVRTRVLAEEAPRDWSKVRLRLMTDCQSGAFYHYSRFQAVTDYDNAPRVFSLPMMLTGEYAAQRLPPYLVYTAAIDLVDWRWRKLSPIVDLSLFEEALGRFTDMVVRGNHRCLIFLPPQDGPLEFFQLHENCAAHRYRGNHPVVNALWRAAAARLPDHITLVELAGMLAPEDMVHAHHYVPSALQRIAGVIDDWYSEQEAPESQPIAQAA